MIDRSKFEKAIADNDKINNLDEETREFIIEQINLHIEDSVAPFLRDVLNVLADCTEEGYDSICIKFVGKKDNKKTPLENEIWVRIAK